ncbi:hypothetical protein BDZ89DRAFT_1173833 [Hymenopellis radicata]|nr:hypothetical protein BDZ89DRAFT_1173833 [Hymenopellis radicata]
MSHFTVLHPCLITADGETEYCQPDFNLPFDATSAEAIEAFTEGVKKDAKTALQCPLRRGYDFDTQRFAFNITHSQVVDARTLPSFAQPGVNRIVRIRLVKEIESEDESDEERRLSQVWEAHVEPVGAPTGIQERVILKIYRQSAMELPRLESREPLQVFDTRRELAGGEALAYEKLLEVQGKTIPYMFGLFEVIMPNNEKAYVLVLEYIAGFTLYELANAFSEDDPEHDGDSDAWQRHLMLYRKLVSLSFAALQTFHDCGVAHNKMHPSNVIIVPPVQNLELANPDNLAIDGNFSAVIVNLRSHSLLKEQRGQELNDETKEIDREEISGNLGACCDSHGAVVAAAMKEATENSKSIP